MTVPNLFTRDGAIDDDKIAGLDDAKLADHQVTLEAEYEQALAAYRDPGQERPDNLQALATRLRNLRAHVRARGEASGVRNIVAVSQPDDVD